MKKICILGLFIGIFLLAGCGHSTKSLNSGNQQNQGWRPTVPNKPPQSNTASNDLMVKLLNQQRKMRGQEKIAPPPEQPAAKEEKKAPKQEKEQTATPPAKSDATPNESTSLATRVSALEERVEANTQVIGATQKVVFKNRERIKWLEAYQRKMDARMAQLTWNGFDNDLNPIRLSGFAPGSAVLTARGRIQTKATLKRLVEIEKQAKAQGKTLYVDVLGYASADGSKKKNQLLSFERAKAVAKIIKKGGISVVSVKGMGETNAGLYGNTNRCVRILTIIK